ncbi:hypothetical protein BSKO_07497 [Bryopsis sp. KO-2023]|nr:hypothetical protein BSKO_07497 [Bryopsis sp. KO-2023]
MDANVKTFGACLRSSPAVGAAGRVFSREGPTRRPLLRRRNAASCRVFGSAAQVPFPEVNPPNNSLLAKLSKAAILVPAIGVALFSCNNANARPAPVTPEISTSNSVSGASSSPSTLFASASAAMGNPKVRVTALAICLAVAATAAARHSHKKKAMKAKAADKSDSPPDGQSPSKPQKESVPDPGVIILGLAGLMIDAVSDTPKKPRSSQIGASIVEAQPATKEKEKESKVLALEESKGVGVSNAEKYDLFVELVNAGNDLVANPKYDPIRSMLGEASKNVESFTRSFFSLIEWQGDDRYDLVKDLFTRMKTEGIAEDPKYDPLYRALKIDVPTGYRRFDPIGGIVKVARAPVNFVANKFDFLTGFFKGKWQSENMTLDNLPEWDPVSAVHSSAGQPVTFEDNKYDPAETANRREWLAENSTVRSSPKWDPISGMQEAARSPMTFQINRYDVAEVILRGEWLKMISGLSNLPSWDPTSKFVEIATASKESKPSDKYDAIPSLLRGDWRTALGDESWEDEGKSAAQVDQMEVFDASKDIEEMEGIDASKRVEEVEPIGTSIKPVEDSEQGNAISQMEEGDEQGDVGKETQAEQDAEEALLLRLKEKETEEAAKLEAEIAKVASESVAEKIVTSRMEVENDKVKMQKQTRAFESKTKVLKSIAALIREFESVQQMDALKA